MLRYVCRKRREGSTIDEENNRSRMLGYACRVLHMHARALAHGQAVQELRCVT